MKRTLDTIDLQVKETNLIAGEEYSEWVTVFSSKVLTKVYGYLTKNPSIKKFRIVDRKTGYVFNTKESQW